MKNSILNASLVAGAICLSVNVNAQDATHEVSANSQPATNAAAAQTVLNGNWSIATDATGKLFIADKDAKIVKVLDGKGMTDPTKKTIMFNSPFTYPVTLTVDKSGDLHIVDNTSVVSTNKAAVELLAHDTNGFSDPDVPSIAGQKSTQLVSVNKKTK